MGVDRNAFACYGAMVELKNDAGIDDLDPWLTKAKLVYMEWGAPNYGGNGGYIVCDAKKALRVNEGSPCRELKISAGADASSLLTRIEAAVEKGAPFTIVSAVSWWVGMHTY